MTTFPGSLPVRIKLTGNVPLGDYQAQFLAKGPNGTPVHQRNTTIRVLSGSALYIAATATPASVCPGASSQLYAAVIGGAAPFSFTWTPITGLNDPSIQNPVASPTITTKYHVLVTDLNTLTASDSVTVSVLPTPVAPGPITGPSVSCHDSIASYSISVVPGATSYSWTIPADALMLSGQNTPAVTVKWGSGSGTISVIAGNFCGNSNPSVLLVTVLSIPAEPAAIIGPANACNATTLVYSVVSVPDASSYSWTVPPGVVILGGQNTDSITVQWGADAGEISVIAGNICGESPPVIRSINLETLPGQGGTISGNDTVCSNHETYTYSIPPIPAASSYSWDIPQGTTITGSPGNNSIVISIGPAAVSGNISVKGKNSCGAGPASHKYIVVKICDGVQEIIQQQGITVFPNPAEAFINIVVKGEMKQMNLSLVNLNGQTVFNESMENTAPDFKLQVDVTSFSRGMYFLKLITGDKVYVQKIIIR